MNVTKKSISSSSEFDKNISMRKLAIYYRQPRQVKLKK